MNCANIDHLVGDAKGLADLTGHTQFTGMALAVVKGKRMHISMLMEGTMQQGKGIHAAGIHHHSGAVLGRL
jgi:SAM-dependent MidA family methyltransferase